MRCVSKSWNALLSHSSFIKSHLRHSLQNNDGILLFFGIVFSFHLSQPPFIARPSCSPHLELPLQLPTFNKPPVNLPHEYGCGSVVGSVNGLICFYYVSRCDGIVFHIWNPSISALLTLPSSPLPRGRLQFGFGFDPKTDDYKVASLTILPDSHNMEPHGVVYSMRKGSWDLISQKLSSHITWTKDQVGVFVDDDLHCLGTTDLEGKPLTIVAFDLGAEVFIEMPLPESILNRNWYKCLMMLAVLGGKLCVMSKDREGGEWEVWVMDEYGVSESWVKHHVFSPFSGNIFPYGFTSHGEFVFQVDEDDDGHRIRFGLYDPTEAKTKTFNIVWSYSYISRFVEYVDSLVWIQPPNREISSFDISQLRNLQIGQSE